MGIQKIYLELTDDCNLDCKMCYRKSWGHIFGDMKDEVLHKLVNELKMQKDLKEVVIGGIGEPVFAGNFKEALELLKDYKITLTTNGILIDDELAEYIFRYVDNLTVSIDGAPDKYQEIRGTNLNILIDNIKRINRLKISHNSRKPAIDVQFVLSSENVDDVFRVIDIARDLEADRFIVSNVIPQTEAGKDNILYTRYENSEIKDLFQKMILYGMHKGMMVFVPSYELKTVRNCSFIENDAVFICSSGDVSPCYRFSHNCTEYVFGRKKQIEKVVFGNIERESLNDIWNQKKYSGFRECILNNRYASCLDCDLVDGCDYVTSVEMDCFGVSPSCADCLWSRRFTQCP